MVAFIQCFFPVPPHLERIKTDSFNKSCCSFFLFVFTDGLCFLRNKPTIGNNHAAKSTLDTDESYAFCAFSSQSNIFFVFISYFLFQLNNRNLFLDQSVSLLIVWASIPLTKLKNCLSISDFRLILFIKYIKSM